MKKKITSFPTQSLTASIELVTKVVKSRGEVGSTIKEIALVTGIGEGTLILPVSSCCQYMIYESVYGSGYKPTNLFQRIQMPTFAEDKKKAIFEALNNPLLYKELISEFNGKVLPDEKGLANYLVKEFGFKAYAIPKIVKAFFENFREYIDGNNKLRFIYSTNGTEEIEIAQPPLNENNGKPPLNREEQIDMSLPLDNSNGTGYTVHIFGAGINSKLSLAEEDDFLILEAMINKLKKKIKNSE